MVTNAFRCDGCRRYYSGEPAFSGSISGRKFSENRDGEWGQYAVLKHNVARDHDPRDKPQIEVEWPVPGQGKSFGLCAECFAEHLLDAVQGIFADGDAHDAHDGVEVDDAG